MNTFTIELTDAELKALAFVALDPYDWMVNAVKERCRLAMEEIFQAEVARMVQDPKVKEIPADREAVVLAADIKPAKQVNDERLASVPGNETPIV
jgi:hypothetical protein